MPFFFSYKTFARLSAATVASSNAIPGEPITMSPKSPVLNFGRTPPGRTEDGGKGVCTEAFASNEGAQTSDGFAHDQILHLIGAFIGIERFGIGEEPRGLVVGDDAVAAQQFAAPCDGLA